MSAIPAIWDQGGTCYLILQTSKLSLYNFAQTYTSESQVNSDDIRSFFGSLNLPTLSDEQCDSLEAPIMVEEIVEVIRSLPSGKAPGLDGFTAGFYKCYAVELALTLF